MTREVQLPPEDYDRVEDRRTVTFNDGNGRRSVWREVEQWREKVDRWAGSLRNVLLVGGAIGGTIFGLHKFATAPLVHELVDLRETVEDEVRRIETSLATHFAVGTQDRYTGEIAMWMEVERGKLNPSYAPISPERMSEIQHQFYPRPSPLLMLSAPRQTEDGRNGTDKADSVDGSR